MALFTDGVLAFIYDLFYSQDATLAPLLSQRLHDSAVIGWKNIPVDFPFRITEKP